MGRLLLIDRINIAKRKGKKNRKKRIEWSPLLTEEVTYKLWYGQLKSTTNILIIFFRNANKTFEAYSQKWHKGLLLDQHLKWLEDRQLSDANRYFMIKDQRVILAAYIVGEICVKWAAFHRQTKQSGLIICNWFGGRVIPEDLADY